MPPSRRRSRPMQAPETFVDLLFPVAGVDVSGPFGLQRPRTTPAAQNVRAFEPQTNRARGGQRPGLISYIAGTVNGNFGIQSIDALTDTTGTGGGASSSSATAIWTRSPGDALQIATLYLNNGATNVSSYASGSLCGSELTSIGTTLFSLAGNTLGSKVWQIVQMYPNKFIASGNLPGPQPVNFPYIGSVGTDGAKFFAISSSDGNIYVQRLTTTGTSDYSTTTAVTNALGQSVNLSQNNANTCAYSVISGGIIYSVFSTGYVVQTKTVDGTANSPVILAGPANISLAAPGYQIAGATSAPPASAIVGSVLAVPIVNPTTGKGGVAFINTSTGVVTATTNLAGTLVAAAVTTDATSFYALFGDLAGSNVVKLNTSGVVQWTTSLSSPGQPGTLAYVAGVTSIIVSTLLNSFTLDTSGNITGGGIGVGLLALFDGGTITVPAPNNPGQDTLFNRNLVLLAISNGSLKVAKNGAWTSPAAGSIGFSGTVRVIRSAANQQKMYYVDANSYVFYDPAINKTVTWTASSGNLPKDGSGNFCRLIATWRGRTVLSGLPNDPQNWFMSKVNDPTDWNYNPQFNSPTQAVAGNNSPLGLVGRPVTALMPYTDDLLAFGLDTELWVMRGDPMAGGQLDRVSKEMGVVWGNAWTQDPYGNLYFMSNRCRIFQWVPGNQPQPLSQAIDYLLNLISLDDVIVSMAWNDQQQGLHVFVTHIQNARPETHFFWEYRTGGWQTDTFGKNEHSPFMALTFYGSTSSDRACLIGSWDGHVRSFNVGAVNDEGIAIQSVVVLGPIEPNGLDEFLLKDIQAVLSANSTTVTYSILIGQTPELALTSTAVATGTLGGGRNALSLARYAGYAIYVKLSASNPWAMELVRCRLAGRPFTGKVRGRSIKI